MRVDDLALDPSALVSRDSLLIAPPQLQKPSPAEPTAEAVHQIIDRRTDAFDFLLDLMNPGNRPEICASKMTLTASSCAITYRSHARRLASHSVFPGCGSGSGSRPKSAASMAAAGGSNRRTTAIAVGSRLCPRSTPTK